MQAGTVPVRWNRSSLTCGGDGAARAFSAPPPGRGVSPRVGRPLGAGRLGAVPYLLPAFGFFVLFAIVPLVQTFILSFYEWNGVTDRVYVGLDNYRSAFTDPDIRDALNHSIQFVFFYSVLPLVLALGFVSLVTHVRIRGMTWFRTALFIPVILPLTVSAVAWKGIYARDGPINWLLDNVGLGAVSRAWLGDFTWALPALGLIGTWVTFGLVFVLLLAGVQKIPIELYEAARIDGASAIREFFAVTLPGLRGEVTVAMIITVIAALRNFDIVFITTGGGPGQSTTVPSVFIYRSVFQLRRVGLGAAIGILLMVLLFIVIGLIFAYRVSGEDRRD